MITSTNIVPIIICMVFMIGTMFLSNQNAKNDLTTAVIIACGIVVPDAILEWFVQNDVYWK